MTHVRKTPQQKAWETRRRKQRTGLCSVYVMYGEGFDGVLRPAHDTAPHARCTQKQVRALVGIIHRYMFKCRERART